MGKKENSNFLWNSIEEVAKTLQKSYSVTGKKAILKQYLNQVKQYPFYQDWFDKISMKMPKNIRLDIIEYGSGPGFLTKMILKNHKINSYLVIEPEKIFREMTLEKSKNKVKVLDSTAEKFISKNKVHFIIMTATYHHMHNKLKAMNNVYRNLKKNGKLIMGEVFIPDYYYDKKYNPKDKLNFTEKVISYTAEQIRFMPNPKNEDVADQIKTAFLDVLRIEELKVCIKILIDQLKKVGFKNIKVKLMAEKNKSINYKTLGWYIMEATK